MNQLALNTATPDLRPRLTVITNPKPLVRTSTTFSFPTREMLVLGIVMALLQLSDGILTGIGMHVYGTWAEGNPVIRYLMEAIGFIPALIIIKSVAIGVVATLCLLAERVRWVPLAMRGMIVVYLCAAVVPWTKILLSHVLWN